MGAGMRIICQIARTCSRTIVKMLQADKAERHQYIDEDKKLYILLERLIVRLKAG